MQLQLQLQLQVQLQYRAGNMQLDSYQQPHRILSRN